MTRKPAWNAFPFALIAVLFWSTIPTAFKLGLRHQEPYSLLLGASLASTIVLALILLSGRRLRRLAAFTPADVGFSALMGLLSPVAYYLILLRAYEILPAQVAQPLNMIWPIVLVLISIPVMGHRVNWKSVGAMCISFGGVVVISLQGSSGDKHPDNLLGIVLALSSSVIWAFYFILNARDGRDPVVRLFLNFLFSSVYLLLGAVILKIPVPETGPAWITAAYVGCFEMGITFVLWLTAMRRTRVPDRIGNLVYIAPFLNLLVVHLVLGEQIYLTTLAGIILLVSGILLQNAIRKGG